MGATEARELLEQGPYGPSSSARRWSSVLCAPSLPEESLPPGSALTLGLRRDLQFLSSVFLRRVHLGVHRLQKQQSSQDSVLQAYICNQEVGLFCSPLYTGLSRKELVSQDC